MSSLMFECMSLSTRRNPEFCQTNCVISRTESSISFDVEERRVIVGKHFCMWNINFQTEYSLSRSTDNPAMQEGYSGGGEEWGESDADMGSLIGCDIDFFENKTVDPVFAVPKNHISQQLQQFTCFERRVNPYQYVYSQIPPGDHEFQKTEWTYSQSPEMMERLKAPDLFRSASFEILNKYGSRSRRLNGELMNISMECALSSGLSVEMMIRLAAENFMQTTSQSSNDLPVLSHPYPDSILCHSREDFEGVQLVQSLLSCAEKVGKKQYDSAYKLLIECDKKSSPEGTVVQRLVFYFTEALYEKIDRETGRITPKGLGKKIEDPLQAVQSPDSAQIAFHKELPLSQITKFAGIQAVLDNVADARKVHFIDFEIRKGIQCIILMQALAAATRRRPIDYLKITAVGTRSKESIEETGRQLMSFAQCLGLQLFFDVVMVDNIFNISENQFQLDADEAIAVYAAFTLTHMISRPDQIEHLLGVIKTINPCVMVVTEVEANCNSPIFVDRFVEALFFYGAYFESMADCLKNDEKHRSLAEGTCFNSSIRNIVAAEGEQRKIRHVSVDVWRAFFLHFGLEEKELSMSSMYQARLVLKNFTYGDCFTFKIDGKSLIICWKGTPISSLSAWKFQCPQ